MVVSVVDWIATHFFMWNAFDTNRHKRVTKKEVEVKGAKRAIIFYPFWTGSSSFYNTLASHFPDSTKVFYDYPNEVMSEDVRVSLRYIQEVLDDSVKLIKSLRKKGVKEVVLVGSSTGSNLAFKVATMIKVEKVVLNMLDRDIAKAIFTSPALGILKKKLEKHDFSLEKLKKVYKFISVDEHLKDIKKKSPNVKLLFFVSVSDIFTPARSFKETFNSMDKMKIDYRVYTNYFYGHVLGLYKNVNSSRMRNFIED